MNHLMMFMARKVLSVVTVKAAPPYFKLAESKKTSRIVFVQYMSDLGSHLTGPVMFFFKDFAGTFVGIGFFLIRSSILNAVWTFVQQIITFTCVL